VPSACFLSTGLRPGVTQLAVQTAPYFIPEQQHRVPNSSPMIENTVSTLRMLLSHLFVRWRNSLLCWVVIFVLSPAFAHGAITGVNVSTASGLTHLVSITLDDGHSVQRTGQELIGIEAFHYISSASSATTNPSLLSTTDPTGNGEALLDNDDVLNTGFFNIASGSGIAVGESPVQNSTLGLGINFLSPVINGPGYDIVLFDLILGASLSQAFDRVVVSGLTGGLSYAAHSTGFKLFNPGSPSLYPSFARSIATANQYKQDNLASLADLENNVATLVSWTGPPGFIQALGVRAIGIDLTDLGVLTSQSVTGIFIQSATGASFDPVFIAGLQPVPEPSSFASCSSAVIFVLLMRLLAQDPFKFFRTKCKLPRLKFETL
jgi:hypothetical protein